jgi:RHS repeat-associated protein
MSRKHSCTPSFRATRGICFFFLFLFFLAVPTPAQVQTGTPPFGSFSGGPDVINLGNLNSHIAIPVLHKPGRGGMNFTFDLTYDTSIWYPVTSGSTKTWTPVGNWGWSSISQAVAGYLSFKETTTTKDSGLCTIYTYTNYAFHDVFGTAHPFIGSAVLEDWGGIDGQNTNCFSIPLNSTTSDGSGLKLSSNGLIGTVTFPNGTSERAPLSPNGIATVVDRNGNEVSVTGGGGAYTFTDTLGTTALTTSGTPPTSTTFTYTAPSGVAAPYTMSYVSYTVATNFAVSGINEYGAAATNLVDRVTLPDNSFYQFSYEPTPSTPSSGACTPKSGTYSTNCVTGRLWKVTLPTGGQIIYAYSGGAGSNGSGIYSDGSAATLTRTTPDTGSNSWTYARTLVSGTQWQTIVTDPERDTLAPSGNDTVIQFQGIYETERQVYQGLHTSGTQLRQWTTCYNGNASNCNSTAIALPITQRTVTDQYGVSGPLCQHIYKYNSVGGLTEQDDYDYPSGTTLLRKVLITFASLANITAFKQQVTVQNGAGTTVSQTNYNYDETTPAATSGIAQHTSVTGSRGNLTSINYPVSGLTSTFTYYDTGTPNTSVDVNGATTAYNYSSTNNAYCQMAFPTSISEPLSLSRSMTWNCTGGVQLTAVDENSQTMTTNYSDPYFWRPASALDQGSNTTTFNYYAPVPARAEAYVFFNSGNSIAEQLTTLDGLGRVSVTQRQQAPGVSNFDTIEKDYDALGRPSRVTLPYFSNSYGQKNSSAPAQTSTYDALNRPLQTADSGGGSTTYTYPQNDVLVTIGPAPSGENTKRRQLEYDSLGRLTSVCELTSLSGSGTCGQTSAQTGYWTKYTYDPLGDLLTVTQNAQASSGSQQTRTYTYDAMGRLISETNPENGATTYAYDSIASGNCAATYKGDLIKRVDAVGNATCYSYDTLHRPLTITYAGPYSSATAMKVFYYDAPHFNSTSNTRGRLASAGTCLNPTCAGNWLTAEDFSYSARGEITDVYEATPHTYPVFYHITQTYWPNGAPNQLGNNIATLPVFTYAVDGEGRPNSVSVGPGYGQNPVTSTTYNLYTSPNQLTTTFGSGDSDVFSFDPNTLRMNKYQFKIGTQTVTGTLGWNSNGSLGNLNITDPFSTANTQNCAFTDDDLARISKTDCGSIWGQNFSYDPFGNIQQNGISGTGGSSFLPTYQSSPSITNRVFSVNGVSATYDANGNSLNDTFRTFTWDADNNPVTIGSVALTYDAFDRMVEQSVSGTNSQVVYSPAGVKFALMNGSTLTKAFAPLTGGGTAVYTSSGLAYYRHTDHLGSSRFASTTSQTLYSDTAYSPFGEPYASSGAIDNSFTGQNQDTTSGLYDFLYREHDPNQARWTQSDPAGFAAVDPTNPQSWNRYVYVLNDPIDLFDPSGLCPVTGCYTFFGGQDGGNCAEDGINVPCSIAVADLQSGAANLCANPNCTSPVSPGIYILDGGGSVIITGECASVVVAGQSAGDNCVITGTTTFGLGVFPYFSPTVGNLASGGGGAGGSYNPAILWSTGKGILSPVTNGVSYVCGQSKPSRAFKSIRNGAIVGAASGAYTGFVSGEVFGGEVTLGTSGLGGAVVGGFFGGAAGATKGVFKGIVLAETCSELGAYN